MSVLTAMPPHVGLDGHAAAACQMAPPLHRESDDVAERR